MFRNAILASLLVFGAAGAASAEQIRVTANGENYAIAYPHESSMNVVGGGYVTTVGNGENAQYIRAPGAPAQPGRFATFVGGSEGNVVTIEPTPRTPRG
jgi:hypothetical protein